MCERIFFVFHLFAIVHTVDNNKLALTQKSNCYYNTRERAHVRFSSSSFSFSFLRHHFHFFFFAFLFILFRFFSQLTKTKTSSILLLVSIAFHLRSVDEAIR